MAKKKNTKDLAKEHGKYYQQEVTLLQGNDATLNLGPDTGALRKKFRQYVVQAASTAIETYLKDLDTNTHEQKWVVELRFMPGEKTRLGQSVKRRKKPKRGGDDCCSCGCGCGCSA